MRNDTQMIYTVTYVLMIPFRLYLIHVCQLFKASDKVYQLLAHGRWFSPGTLASSTTKTGPHDIAEILLKVVLNTKNHSINQCI
jgi:hypothetical protein